MALDNKTLKDFFDKNKNPLLSTSVKKIRVFDEPDNILSKTTEDKVKTEQESRDKIKPKIETNQGQRAYLSKESKDKSESKVKTIHTTKEEQTRDNISLSTYSSLTGLQRAITLFIYDHCAIARNEKTNPIAIEYLSTRCETTISSAKKTIQRLVKKGIISKIISKNGRNGWSQYQLNDAISSEIKLDEYRGNYRENWRQIEDKSESKVETYTKTMLPSSSSLNKTTTEEETREFHSVLPTEWENIDITPLESIGFNTNKLKQIYHAHKLSAEMVQDSIYAYAFDREINKVQHQSPINFIMSLLKVKGMPYEFPENYESPQERAIRLYHERKRAHKEKQQQYVESLKLEAFEEWLSELPPEEQEQLIPWEARKLPSMRRSALFHHYQEKLWPAHEKNIVGKIT